MPVLFACLEEITPLGDSLQVAATGSIRQNSPVAISPNALRSAAAAFLRGPSILGEMLNTAVEPAGGVVEIVIGDDGNAHVVATVTKDVTAKKVARGVLKAIALVIKVEARGELSIRSVSLVDVPAPDSFGDAVTKGASAGDRTSDALDRAADLVGRLQAGTVYLAAALSAYEHQRAVRR